MILRAATALLALTLLGGLCSGPGGGGGGGPAPPPVAAWIEPAFVAKPIGAQFSMDVVIHTDVASPQAWEIAITTDPSVVSFDSVDAHPEYDDDGVLFGTPQIDNQAGTVTRIVDVRHGPHPLSGEVRIATLNLEAVAAGGAWIELQVTGMADGEGVEFEATVMDHSVVSISP